MHEQLNGEMKISANWPLFWSIAAFCCSNGNAQIIHSNSLSGAQGLTIKWISPTAANKREGWSYLFEQNIELPARCVRCLGGRNCFDADCTAN
jgi:hypothetical protein